MIAKDSAEEKYAPPGLRVIVYYIRKNGTLPALMLRPVAYDKEG